MQCLSHSLVSFLVILSKEILIHLEASNLRVPCLYSCLEHFSELLSLSEPLLIFLLLHVSA